MASLTQVQVSDKWSSGQPTEGKTLVLTCKMAFNKVITKKGTEFLSLGSMGNAFGGEEIGRDDKGNRIMVKGAIYLKPANNTVSSKSSISVA